MTTLKERQFQLRESTIVEAMHHLLVERGYAETSMDDVAAEVGISKATLYLHFKSKKELVLKVIVQSLEKAEAGIWRLDPSLPAIERIRRALENGIRIRTRMGSTQIDLMPQEIHDDPAFRKAERRAHESVEALIREAQQDGTVRTDIAPALIREFIVAIFDMDFEGLIKDGASVDHIVEQLVDMIARAIRP
jgi:AcrR family transcriptional regulator